MERDRPAGPPWDRGDRGGASDGDRPAGVSAGSPVVGELPRLLGEGLLGEGLDRRLERWAAEARVDEAARRRSRERWLLQQAEEEGTFAGVLADLAERGAPVTVRTRTSDPRAGRIGAIGADFVAVRSSAGSEALVRLDQVVAVQTPPGEPFTAGDRRVEAQLTLAEVLVRLAGERARLTLVLDGGSRVGGTLRSMGDDVVAVRLDDEGPAGITYVPVAAVAEVVLGT